jgi:hypothetical protein
MVNMFLSADAAWLSSACASQADASRGINDASLR